jgi:uncharacterized membrane protein
MRDSEHSKQTTAGNSYDVSSAFFRLLLASIFVVAGISHFLFPAPYLRIIPPALPHPWVLLWVSGVAEILGGIGLLLEKACRAAALGLAVLLVAVFPANIYMAAAHVPFPGIFGQAWLQWLRLPLQPILIWRVLQYSKEQSTRAE